MVQNILFDLLEIVPILILLKLSKSTILKFN